MNWKFYYDEAFHDRKVTIKNEKINIYADNASDIFVGFFNGYQENDTVDIWKQYNELEAKYKNIFTLEEDKELKGTIIKRKNYKNGFASFVPNTIDFYSDFFNLLNNEKVILHISMFSKTELLVREFLRNIQFSNKFQINEDAFIYSIVKFLYNYRNQTLLAKMMQIVSKNDAENILDELKKMLHIVINESINIKRKQVERNGLMEIYCILEDASIKNFEQPQLSWRYKPIFIGFNKLLKERGIPQSEVELVIDEEKNTLEAAKSEGNYKSCECVPSYDSIGVRISDILSHFFGELSLALAVELREKEIKKEQDLIEYNYFTKKLLSKKWFCVSKKQFILWRNIELLFYNYQLFEWTGYGGIYFDYSMVTFALLEYIFQYETYEDFTKVSSELHCEYFNTYCCKKISMLYERGGSKPAI